MRAGTTAAMTPMMVALTPRKRSSVVELASARVRGNRSQPNDVDGDEDVAALSTDAGSALHRMTPAISVSISNRRRLNPRFNSAREPSSVRLASGRTYKGSTLVDRPSAILSSASIRSPQMRATQQRVNWQPTDVGRRRKLAMRMAAIVANARSISISS